MRGGGGGFIYSLPGHLLLRGPQRGRKGGGVPDPRDRRQNVTSYIDCFSKRILRLLAMPLNESGCWKKEAEPPSAGLHEAAAE